MAQKAVETPPAERNGDEPQELAPLPQPGEISTDEMWTLYQAAEIKVRAFNEQVAERDRLLAGSNQLLAVIMQTLGVDHTNKILPAIEALTKNRQARRAEKKPRARKPPAAGARKS